MNVGRQIKKVLKEKPEMNQERLAELSGVSKDRISRIVNQRALPSMNELKKIADALRVKPDFLVSDSDEVVFHFTEKDKKFLELLEEPDLAISLRALSKLSLEDRKAINKVIQRFSEMTEDRMTMTG
jgi:transcriptional regulator with XRE-family HTH domain